MSSTKNKIVLKKLKDTDNVWHSESTLVFKSSKDKVVIGRYFEKEIIPLDDLCLELCSKWKFKYDKDLVEEEDEEEVVENEDGDQQESEQENIKEKDQREDDVETEKKDNEEEDINEDREDESEEDEEKVESEQITEVKFEKDEIKIEDINYTKETYLTDITSDYSKKIYNYFDSVSQKYNQELLNLKNDITTKDKIHSELLKEHESVKEELKKLKTKFDGIKQLFSL
jgi:hypothetical protein